MAVIAIISILGGFLYVQDLKGEVESLRTVVATQQKTISTVVSEMRSSKQQLQNYRKEQISIESNYNNARNNIDVTSKSAKGINRIIDDAVIRSLCSAYEGKYCSASLYSIGTSDTVRQANPQR